MNKVNESSPASKTSDVERVVMRDDLCKCGHDIASHEDYDFDPHECHKCDCVPFVFADDT